MLPRKLAVLAIAVLLSACTARGHAVSPAATPPTIAADGAPREPLAWAELTPATFARAKTARRFIVLDGSAEWCHWCHVMEATTYHDPDVATILAASFIVVKVDVDSRPDIEERYGAWGWPATVIFSPNAEELGKYRGYIAPSDFAGILRDVVAAGKGSTAAPPRTQMTALPASRAPLPEEELLWIQRAIELSLDDYYDDDQGGWGRSQKAPIAEDNGWALDRARAGDGVMRERVLFTLDKQRAILDPVWGGIYQYSAGSDWTHPHFEKLMPFEAGALSNYAEAYALTGDAKDLATAQAVRHYIDVFLSSKEGGFYATQDADLNAHDAKRPFVSGHDYYALDDAHRRALGIPRVDTHEYARDNGLAIAAYVTLYQATCTTGPRACDGSALTSAERAAARILATHLSPKGGVSHDAAPEAHVLYLADNAAFAWGLLRLYEATHEATYLDAAGRIGDFMLRELVDPESGGFFASSEDPDAAGVFTRRRVSFEDNVTAIRVFAKLVRWGVEGRREADRAAMDRALRAIARPEEIQERGRMIGDFLFALEETKGARGGQ
jgi:uncharacterized protein YyaL (SSP411 family)